MKQTLGQFIQDLRKKKGLTQAELAEYMGVSDKAVSKWERDLSCPDINSIPKLASYLGVSVDELMNVEKHNENKNETEELISLILKVIPLAMSIAVIVLNIMNKIDIKSSIIMLGIGLFSESLYMLQNK